MIENRNPAIWTGMYVELPLHKAIKQFSSLGWKSVEICTEHLEMLEHSEESEKLVELAVQASIDEKVETLQSHGHLGAAVAHPDRGRALSDIARLKKHILLSSSFGVETIVIHPGQYNGITTRADYKAMVDRNVEAFKDLADYAGEHGMKIGLENLNRRLFASSAELLDLISAINHPGIGVTFDSSHARMTPGIDILSAIKDFGELLIATHLSDNDGSGDQHLTPGGGKIEWRPLMQALEDINYAGVINFELPGERHPDEELKALKTQHALNVANYLLRKTD